jgi:hypothetical protein
MNRIHRKVSETFPGSLASIRWDGETNNNSSAGSGRPGKHNSTNHRSQQQLGPEIICFPVLNLHDELIFEVRKGKLAQVAELIRREMESSLELRVPLPVVIKTGTSWGSLCTFNQQDGS